ncbi:MAG: CheR family methyltransferase [Candidatus Sumerlaeota bacterium]
MADSATLAGRTRSRRLDFSLTDDPLKNYHGVRIQQGETYVGTEVQGTYLKSCMCVGFYHGERGIGAISHITAFRDDGAHTPAGALSELEKKLKKFGLRPGDCQCFLIGGVDKARHVYERTASELTRRGIPYKILDVLGEYHRKLLLDPSTGKLLLYKKAGGEVLAEAKRAFSSDRSYQVFHDPKRRLITGASLFFRNETLLEHITRTVAPVYAKEGGRFHIWCAGCSLGMEAYSVAMVVMNHLDRLGLKKLDFRILGTDISDEALAKAKAGEYNLSRDAVKKYASIFEKYTTRMDSRTIRVNPQIRSKVHFIQRDIREGSRKHRFEMVLCDHVFQYFDTDVQLEFLKGLVTGVQPRGFLYVSSPSPHPQRALTQNGAYECLSRHFYRQLRGTIAAG